MCCNTRALILYPLCRRAALFVAGALLLAAFAASAFAQTSVGPSQPSITQPISEGNLVVLSGNTRPEARDPANDRGIVPDSLPMPHMLLQLRRPAAQEQALATLIDQLHDMQSPNFHHWLSASELGEQYGPAASDIQAISGWLQQHGFTVNTLYPNRMVIDFSGTAGLIRTAFRTEIHNLSVNGVAHFANMADPQIPAALAPAVIGIVALHDFRPKSGAVRNPTAGPRPEYTNGGNYWVTPPDLATIYNFNPVFATGITGRGQTIYLIEDSNLYSTNDWTKFRSAFGLSGYTSATLTTIHPPPPSGPNNCSNPGVNGDGGEAILDAEYSSAAAPSAAIVMATCSSVITAIENVLNGPNPPAIVSISYIDCEVYNGASANAALYSAYQTGVAAGTSVIGIAGDEDAAVCDYGGPVATHGIGANGLASTPYDVALGGTDFADTYLGENSTYWNSSNTSHYGSAKSYIPEIPWNSTCGSQLSAKYNGFTTTYGASGFCNNSAANTGNFLSDWGGSGGPSSCAYGAATTTGVVSGTCSGYAKPSWQSGFVGIVNDGVRDLPDVSLFASFGPWNHGYVICWSDPSETKKGSAPCTGVPNNWSTDWGGTSFAAPIYAGIQALINQHEHGSQGNPNYRLYALAATEYGPRGNKNCTPGRGGAGASACVFHDVTLGDNDAPCRYATPNCYEPDKSDYGVLSNSTSGYEPAFTTTVGWDFATGIGSINVANLVAKWSTVLIATPGAGRAPLTVNIRSEGLAFPMIYTMNFGDGTTGPVMERGCTEGSGGVECTGSSSHKYTIAGIYTATLLNASNVTLGAVTISVGRSITRPGAGPNPIPQ
jgi:subtilase family serine protease